MPYQLDLQQSGFTLLQVDGAVITGALIFLTLSSLASSITTATSGNSSEEVNVKWLLSIITAAVITPFVVSAAFVLVALYARTPDDAKRAGFIHNGFTSSLIGFIYVPGFIMIAALGVYYAHTTPQATLFWPVIVAGIVVLVLGVLIPVRLRRGTGQNTHSYLNIE